MQKILISTPSELLLSGASDKLDDIRQAAGVSPQIWEMFYMPMLRAFADQVQRLPLSRDVFSADSGALDFGLIASVIALRFACGQMFFPKALSEDRRKLEPQCYFAAFVATLATAVSLVAENIVVKSIDGDAEYHPLVAPVPLVTWLAINPDSKMEWRVGDEPLTSPESGAIAARFIPTGLLNNFDFSVSRMIFGSISPQLAANGIETTLSKVVRQSVSRVLEHQQSIDRKHYTEASSSLNRPSFSETILGSTAQPEPIPSHSASPLQTSAAAATTAKGPEMEVPMPEASTDAKLEVANALLAKAHGALRDWFKAIRCHEKFVLLQSEFVVSDRGIEIPITLLGQFGIGGPAVRKMLQEAELVVDRTENGRGIILLPGLSPFFFDPISP